MAEATNLTEILQGVFSSLVEKQKQLYPLRYQQWDLEDKTFELENEIKHLQEFVVKVEVEAEEVEDYWYIASIKPVNDPDELGDRVQVFVISL